MDSKRPRLQCPQCQQTLSYSAYCRHQRQRTCASTSSDDNESRHSDSTFEFDDLSQCGSPLGDVAEPVTVHAITDSASDSEEHCSSSGEENDSAPEVWEHESDSDSENAIVNDGDMQQSKDIQFGISYFVLFLQVCHHLSDRGAKLILHLIFSLFLWVASLSNNRFISQVLSGFPRTLYSMRKTLQCANNFTKYCVCSTCHSLYTVQDSIVLGPNNAMISRTCDHVEFPNHPQMSRRSKCGTTLMKKIKVGKNYKLVPRKMFVYNSITYSLRRLMGRPGFIESCEAWRSSSSDELMSDVYDGKIWKDWFEFNGQPFLTIPGNLLLLFNVDWFQPFTHSPYSAGIMYLVVQNLPRKLRFKPENVIIVATIPGPKEPKLNINTYLKPMVDELLDLWTGVRIDTPCSLLKSRLVRCALAGICSDIPATRKLCGFYSFGARHGCSKCLKVFPCESFHEKPNYSGFDREEWTPRDMQKHREIAEKALKARTLKDRREIESEIGIRYSELLRLPYLDLVRAHLIDPMHNLFLGTAKNVMAIWKSTGILSDADFLNIQNIVDSFIMPYSIGRLPTKIASSFAGFTAEQWMLWTIVFSPYVLRGYLPSDHYHMWCAFSKACALLCRPFIHRSELEMGDELLLQFCKAFERIIGPKLVTPNMHLHGHLKDCIIDMGPVFSFWCFSFERYNGILENFQKNWHCPEIQLIEKFVIMQGLHATGLPSSLPKDFTEVLATSRKNSLLDDNFHIIDSHNLLNYEKYLYCVPREVRAIKDGLFHHIIPPIREKYFEEYTRDFLKNLYQKLYSPSQVCHVPLRYEEFAKVEVFGQLYTSLKSRSQRSAMIIAVWPKLGGSIIDRTASLEDVRSGVVEYYICHVPTITSDNGHQQQQVHIFAKVKWYEDHPQKYFFGNGSLVSATTFERESEATFLPLCRIMSRCACAEQLCDFSYGQDRVIVSLPLTRRLYI